jgi:hypothetical protein
MADQPLRAHEMMEYVYNVADVAYPVSIRDQMIRARWLVQKAHDLGFFGLGRDQPYRRLLVCGAGAAGVTAGPLRRPTASLHSPRITRSQGKWQIAPDYLNNRRKPACSKWRSVVNASVKRRRCMRTKLAQSTGLQPLSGRDCQSCQASASSTA